MRSKKNEGRIRVKTAIMSIPCLDFGLTLKATIDNPIARNTIAEA